MSETSMLSRRYILTALAALAAAPAAAQPRRRTIPFDPQIAAIERRHGGRLGVFALDTSHAQEHGLARG